VAKNPFGPIPQNDRDARAGALKLSVSERGRVRLLLQDYLTRTGLVVRDMAHRVGYSTESLHSLIEDRYQEVSGNSAHICRAITEFIAAHPIAPSTQAFGELFETGNVRALRKTFQALLPRPVVHMVYAPPGSQKSFVLEHLVAELNRAELVKDGAGAYRAYYVYARVKITPTHLMKDIALACGISSIGDRMRLSRNLAFQFQFRRVLLVVDEAQHLSLDCFEDLRALLDCPPYFSLLFSGSHDLKLLFDRFSATMEQYNSRIVKKLLLPGITREEAEAIVQREIGEKLRSMPPEKARRMSRTLVDLSTSQDSFERDEKGRPRKYINIRTLTNGLAQMKLQDAKAQRQGEASAGRTS
jgi:DNA transposition AAA+ family ATPase